MFNMMKKLLNNLAIEETDSKEIIQQKGIYACIAGLTITTVGMGILVLIQLYL
jgi:hypothetical protein